MITKYKYANIEEGKRHTVHWVNFRGKGQQRHFNEVSGTTVSVVYSNKF